MNNPITITHGKYSCKLRKLRIRSPIISNAWLDTVNIFLENSQNLCCASFGPAKVFLFILHAEEYFIMLLFRGWVESWMVLHITCKLGRWASGKFPHDDTVIDRLKIYSFVVLELGLLPALNSSSRFVYLFIYFHSSQDELSLFLILTYDIPFTITLGL